MIECKICHGNCDPGEIVGGICLDCIEDRNKRIDREDTIDRMMNSPYEQMEMKFDEKKENTGLKITKLKIRNLFGITEYEAGGESIELSGKNGVGKSSVIDAIKYALTNKSDRKYIVRNGETEGEVLIETDTGLRINRKARTNQADYKSVKNNGVEVGSPETFLKDIFTELQLNPVEFMSMTEKQQNAIILDMIEYDWDVTKIREWFGEIPAWVSYDQNILCVLNDIQSENGEYFKARQDINREIRNKKAFVEEIASTIPVGYTLEKWENASAGEIYQQIERIRKENEEIQKAKSLLEERDSKVRKFEADREISKAALTTEFGNRRAQIDKNIVQLQDQIRALETERAGLDERLADKLAVVEQEYNSSVAKYDAEVEAYKVYRDLEVHDVSELVAQAVEIEQIADRDFNDLLSMIGMATAASGAFVLVKNAVNAWENGIDWKNLTGLLSGAAMVVSGLGLAFGSTGAAIGAVISGITLLIVGIHDIMENGVTLQNGLLVVIGTFASVTATVGAAAGAIAAAVAGLVLAVIADWDNFKQTVWEPLKKLASTLLGNFSQLYYGLREIFNGIITFIEGTFNADWETAWEGIKSIFTGIWDAIAGALKATINILIGIINTAYNAIVGVINAIVEALNKINITVPNWVPGLGGKSFGIDIPTIDPVNIPYLATGGIVTSSTIANIGEAGREAVLPLENNTEWMDMLADRIGTDRPIVVKFEGNLAQLGRVLKPVIDAENRRVGPSFLKN